MHWVGYVADAITNVFLAALIVAMVRSMIVHRHCPTLVDIVKWVWNGGQ